MFKRRTPEQSEMPAGLTQKQQYDFIRMLDGEGYPQAFRREKGFRYEMRNARLVDGRVVADETPVPDLS